MTLAEIKAAVLSGQRVFWKQKNYEVKTSDDCWDIICHDNDTCIGLTWRDGVTMNGEPEDFFSEPTFTFLGRIDQGIVIEIEGIKQVWNPIADPTKGSILYQGQNYVWRRDALMGDLWWAGITETPASEV